MIRRAPTERASTSSVTPTLRPTRGKLCSSPYASISRRTGSSKRRSRPSMYVSIRGSTMSMRGTLPGGELGEVEHRFAEWGGGSIGLVLVRLDRVEDQRRSFQEQSKVRGRIASERLGDHVVLVTLPPHLLEHPARDRIEPIPV